MQSRPTAGPANPGPGNHWHIGLQIVIFAIAVLVFLFLSAQLLRPYIAHDDLDFLMPPSWHSGYATAWTKTLTEGRWINYLWYQVSMHLTARSAYLLFVAAYFGATCALATLISDRRLFLILALAIFFSPMFGALSLWPSSLFSGVLLCAIAIWAMARFGDRLSLPILFAATFVLVPAYPPFSTIVLIAAATRQTTTTARSKIIFGLTYLVAFAAGVLLVYILNFYVHGYFGIQIASWRRPDPLRNFHDLIANLGLYPQTWRVILEQDALPFACGIIAAVLLLRKKTTQAIAISLIFAAALAFCVDLGITLITGTPTPPRSVVWLWIAISILCGVTAAQPDRLRKYVGMLLLLAVVASGVNRWWKAYRYHQPAAAAEAEIARKIHQSQAATGLSKVVVFGDPQAVPALRVLPPDAPMPALRMAMAKEYGIHQITECDYDFCTRIIQHLRRRVHTRWTVFAIDKRLVLAFNQLGITRIVRNYPSKSAEAALKLNYPLIVAFDAEAVRLTPFYPGSSKVPVSVALPPHAGGYRLSKATGSCAFPVNYELRTTTGALMARGQYDGSGTLTINGWPAQRGDGIFSVRMASGAKNNYGCNLVLVAAGRIPGAP